MPGSAALLVSDRTRIGVPGPLEPFAAGLRAELTRAGFTRHVVAKHTHLLADMSAWLAQHDLSARDADSDVIATYLIDRRAVGHRYLISSRGIAPTVGYLRALGVVPQQRDLKPTSPIEKLLADYRRYLTDERSLAPLSVQCYLGTARVFLSTLPAPLATSVAALSAAHVTEFVVTEATRRQVWAAKNMVTALRSLLRFLYVSGHAAHSLAPAVPTVPGWGLGTLPRGVDRGLVAALLASCDRASALGRRDYAILLLLSRLGLRNGEVTRLRLDDVDWRAGEMLIRGKGNRHELLPVPDDVGRAVADYLVDGRPPGIDARAVFVIARAPFTPLSLSAVVSIVAAACNRAQVTRICPHQLRHTVASELLARGAPLSEVGQLLRHRDESTTAVYAKLDYRTLGALVRPWPGAR